MTGAGFCLRRLRRPAFPALNICGSLRGDSRPYCCVFCFREPAFGECRFNPDQGVILQCLSGAPLKRCITCRPWMWSSELFASRPFKIGGGTIQNSASDWQQIACSTVTSRSCRRLSGAAFSLLDWISPHKNLPVAGSSWLFAIS